MPTISVKDFWFGPVPFNFYLGVPCRYDCKLQFSDTPPDTFSYSVYIKNINGTLVKTFTGTDIPTQDGLGVITLRWDGTLSPTAAAYGSYAFTVAATAEGYTDMPETKTCSGGNNMPNGGTGGRGRGKKRKNKEDGKDCPCPPRCNAVEIRGG